jgi:putative endonuclease
MGKDIFEEGAGGRKAPSPFLKFPSHPLKMKNAAIGKIMKDARRQLGNHGEDLAAAALKKQGYKILERNYVTPLGEIDLVARQGKTLVIIEVKTRKSTQFGSPQEAVSATKQAKLRRLADYYTKDKRLAGASVRFDVVAITLGDAGPQMEIISNAF